MSNLNIVVNFALAIILSRLLSPDDIGVFSMSAVLIAIAHTFRDFGVTAYLKREKELTDQTIRTARGLLYITSWTMALAMFLSASFWAQFFNEPRVEDVVHVLALGFVFIPFGAIPQAIMGRELNVVQNSKVVLVSTLVYFAASVSLALLGFKHMTMAWANLVNILVSGLAFNLLLNRRLPWMPSLEGWRSMVSFGTANILTALLNVINASLPDLVLGRLSMAANVGLFSRATSTVNMVGKVIEPTINYFTLPYMARMHHATGNVSRDYLRAGSIINCVLLPALAWVALMAREIVLFLYGDQWLGAVSAIPWLCAAIAISTLFTMSTKTVTGVGKPYAALAPLIATIIGKLVAVVIFYDGTLKNFSFAIFAGELVSIPFYLYLKSAYLKVDIFDWTKDTLKIGIIVTTAMVLTKIVMLIDFLKINIVIQFALYAIIITVICAAGYWVAKLPIADEIINAVRSTRKTYKNNKI